MDGELVSIFNTLHSKVKDHAKIKDVSFHQDVAAATTHIDALKSLSDRLAGAPTPFGAAEFYKEVESTVSAAKISCGLVSEHMLGLQKLEAQGVHAFQATKDLWIGDRDLLISKFKGHNIFKSCSKLYADGWQSFLVSPSTAGLNYVLDPKLVSAVNLQVFVCFVKT